MEKTKPGFQEKSFLMKAIIACRSNDLLSTSLSFDLKKLLVVFMISFLGVTSVFGQNIGHRDGVSITLRSQIAPPALLDYVQPPCPGDGYLWNPGYWGWNSSDYYWVPGVWVLPPSVNVLWTPGYWGFYDNFYGWNPGYWGPQVGYYGGINYGFGYFGTGFYGGRWESDRFMYNTSVWRVGKNIHNTYVNKVDFAHNGNRASFNGGQGVRYEPNKDEMNGMHDNRIPPSRDQMEHEKNMGNQMGQFHNNNPKPAIHSMNMFGGQGFDEKGREMKMGGRNRGEGGRGRR